MILNIYYVATPAIMLLMASELIYCWVKKKDYINFHDAVASTGTAILNQAVNLFAFAIAIPVYTYCYEHFRLFELNTLVWFIPGVLAVDFFFYWFHRFCHKVNILWASHVSHHSSQYMNYFSATRTSITQRTLSILFYWPLAILGFAPEVLVPAISLNLVLQFWQHTEVIKRLPRWFEAIFNSPTHHRVHHGTQDQYIDTNFAGVLIIWDKMFGSYAEEIEPVKYGSKQPMYSFDVNAINLHHYRNIFYGLKTIPGLWNKIRFAFGPIQKVPSTPQIHWHEQRSDAKLSLYDKLYLAFQVVIGFFFIEVFLSRNASASLTDYIFPVLTLWIMVTSWGKQLMSSRINIVWEIIKYASLTIAVLTKVNTLQTNPYSILLMGSVVVSILAMVFGIFRNQNLRIAQVKK